MLTFRNTNLFFGILVISILVVGIWTSFPSYTLALIVLLYASILIYGSISIGSNFFLKVLCSGQTSEKVIAISFDDGPVEHYTPAVLRVLKELNVPAAFFCIGKRIVENESIFITIHSEGHLVGNHSFSHNPIIDLFPAGPLLKDLRMTDAAFQRLLNFRPVLFRPPYGVTTPPMNVAIVKGGYTAIGWNIRSFDTIASNEKKLLARLLRSLHPGAIILLHDTKKITLSILPEFIRSARNEGYEFVRLDKLLNVNAYV